jgi:glutathione S-transferase
VSKVRKLYDLAGADPSLRFSPYCWRIKLALAHKNLPFETIPWRFTDKDEIEFSGTGKVPVLIDGEQVVHDSQAIAEYLETEYPNEPTLFNDAATRGLTMFVKNYSETVLQPALARIVLPGIFALIAEKDKAYFRRTREAAFGETIEQVEAKREQYWPVFKSVLVPIRTTLQTQPFIAGPGPAYADHIIFGALQWGVMTSPVPLLEEDDPITVWMRKLLETYGISADT